MFGRFKTAGRVPIQIFSRSYCPVRLSERPPVRPLPTFQIATPLSPLSSFAFSSLRATFRTFSTSASARANRPTYYQSRLGSGGSGRGQAPKSRPSDWKRRLDGVNPQYILYGLIGSNVVVFLGWQYAWSLYQSSYRDPSLVIWLRNNFMVSWRNVSSGRIWTILTATLSHEGMAHLGLNMFALYSTAPAILAMLGNTGFLGLYLFSGIVGSVTSVIFSGFIAKRGSNYGGSHGASGAVLGCLTYFAARFPSATFLVFFVIPAPAWACVGGIFAWDLWSSFKRPYGGIDSAGHVGGVVAGLYWFFRVAGRGRFP